MKVVVAFAKHPKVEKNIISGGHRLVIRLTSKHVTHTVSQPQMGKVESVAHNVSPERNVEKFVPENTRNQSREANAENSPQSLVESGLIKRKLLTLLYQN